MIKIKKTPKKNFLDTTAGKRTIFLLMIPIVTLLNYIAIKVAIFLKIPFFLDTWGTSLGVMAGGLSVGMVGGILYNLIMISEWGINAWVWAFASIWVALIVNFFFKKGWIDIKKPGKVLLVGLIVGLTEAIVVVIILFSAWGGVETYEGVLPTYDALIELTGSKTFAAIAEKFITIPIDQIVSLFIAAIVFSTLPEKFKIRERR